MPFIEINGAQLYYQVHGQPQPGRAPIVLIHGSTLTGRADWAALAPLLAANYHVIVPDCRGHGQSSNPNQTYSFKEMAADTAALVRALGCDRAHIIGHSNGGNVALVTLLEHPAVVQTCVPQAANAYVSQDLIDKEPAVFDPERVARERPEWRDEMIELHGPTHGPDYWRELLRLTVQETVSQPNYTPADLARVRRPMLVVQGADDSVNAPMRHAQFIAEHIPDSEFWIPNGVGHNVHKEAPLEWLRRVLDFLERRGDEANDGLYRLRRARYSDRRETVFEVRAVPGPGGARLTGQVLTPEQREAARAASGARAADEVRLLLPDAPHAIVQRAVTDVRRQPGRLNERVSQALIGESARILSETDGWKLVRLDRDGYIGWVQRGDLLALPDNEISAYQDSAEVLILAELAQVFDEPSLTHRPAGRLPFGTAFPAAGRAEGWTALRLPDGRTAWARNLDLLPLNQRPQPDAAGIEYTLELMRGFLTVPYLWGGRSPYGFDCSGYAGTFWGFMGISLRRDADQQFADGEVIHAAPRPGDLLFFGGEDDPHNREITHVAISLGGDEIIHANATANGVSYNSLNPDSRLYRQWLRDHLAGVRRYA